MISCVDDWPDDCQAAPAVGAQEISIPEAL